MYLYVLEITVENHKDERRFVFDRKSNVTTEYDARLAETELVFENAISVHYSRTYMGGGPKGVAEYIFILLGMRPDAPASANTIRAFSPPDPPFPSYGKLIRARPARGILFPSVNI